MPAPYTYTVTIDTDLKNDGMTAVRNQYNSDNPDNQINDNQDYIQFVMDSAAQSYVSHYIQI